MPNGGRANPLLPVETGSEAVNWGQEGTEEHRETRGGTHEVCTNAPLQTRHVITNPPYLCRHRKHNPPMDDTAPASSPVSSSC
jgi:hypothetical protein